MCLYKISIFKSDEPTLHLMLTVYSWPTHFLNPFLKVEKIDLSKNQLETIPPSLLELPCLCELNLSNNKLRDLPPVPHWSPALTTLDLSHNHLTTIPGDPRAASLHTLNLSHNRLTSVPLCITTFGSLHWLDVSHNSVITTIPPQITNLHLLTHLNLNGLVNLHEVPGSVLASTSDSITYLRCKLSPRSDLNYLLVGILGGRGCGKTTLAMSLGGAGTGAGMSHWSVSGLTPFDRPFSCFLWDCGSCGTGEEAFYHSFRFSEMSLFLLVVDLRPEGGGVETLKLWLNRLASTSLTVAVVIVGTYLDTLVPEKRLEALEVLNKACQMVRSHAPTLQVRDSIAVGLSSGENVPLLRKAVLTHIEARQTKGTFKTAPSSYQQLNSMLLVLKKQVCQGGCVGAMGGAEFRSLLEQSNKVHSGDELGAPVAFLEDMETLVHHHVSGFGDLYFLDGYWFPSVISDIVKNEALSSLATNGVIQTKHIESLLLQGGRLPDQYLKPVLALLDQYDVAITLDDSHTLLPSTLPARQGSFTIATTDQRAPPYTRYITINAAFLGPGFWARLACSVIHYISHSILPVGEGLLQNLQTEPGHTSMPGHTPTGMQYWDSGILYQSPEISFTVGLQKLPWEHSKGDVILVSASRNKAGRSVIGQLVDLILQLANDWYPDLLGAGRQRNTWSQHLAPCYLCEEQKCSPQPFLFGAESCISHIGGTDDVDTISCGVHTALIQDLFPDLMLSEVDMGLHCKATEMSYINPQAAFGQGKLRNKPVTMKTYLSSRNVSLRDLRHDLLLLVRLYHPFVASVVGVCLHPLATLTLEDAPLGSLDGVLASRTTPLPRVVVYRMVWEVAVAMAHIHSKGVIVRDLNTSSVLVWSLEEESLGHCKLADLGGATDLTPSGGRGIPPGHTASKGPHPWLAPEVFFKKGVTMGTYDHRIDIYSLGGLIEQLIREPMLQSMTASNEAGGNNSLQMVSFPYLSQLVLRCRDHTPSKRPALDEVISNVCKVSTQCLLHVLPLDGQFSLRCACTVAPPTFTPGSSTSSNFTNTCSLSSPTSPSPTFPSSPAPADCGELSVICEGANGVEANIFSVDTMATLSKHLIENAQMNCCVYSSDQQLLVASTKDLADCTISILDAARLLPPRTISIGDSTVCSMVCTHGTIYCGTVEGHCLALALGTEPNDHAPLHLSTVVSSDALVGMAVVGDVLWVSHGRVIHFLDLLTLQEVGVANLAAPEHTFVGQLNVVPEGDIVWGAHLGGNCLSAWSASKRSHLFSTNVYDHVTRINSSYTLEDALISTVVPVLDTLWVGMATGHILLFYRQELVFWFRPYEKFVRFLVCIPSPCGGKSPVVVSGGKEMKDIAGSSTYMHTRDGKDLGSAGVVMLWEAHPASLCRQMNMLEKEYSSPHSPSSSSFTDIGRLKRLVTSGEFKDNAHLVSLLSSLKTSDNDSGHNGQSSGTGSNLDERSSGTGSNHSIPVLP